MLLSERINDTNAAPWVIEEIRGIESVLQEWKEYADHLRAERDALAAHVERLRKAALDAIHFVPGGEVKANLRDAYDEEPATSLARQKRLWQAEAISRYAAERLGGTDQELAEIYAGKLRQAEEE